MKQLLTGKFYGNTFSTMSAGGITITETEYTHDWVDWHYHENAYFTFLLRGKLIEGTKKEKNICAEGALLYHNCQEAHYNIKPAGCSRGFHVEVTGEWQKHLGLNAGIEGNYCINSPLVIKKFKNIYSEFSRNNDDTGFAIEEELLDIFGMLQNSASGSSSQKPAWVGYLDNILKQRFNQKLSLKSLSEELDVHPVHLSRDFRKHFNSTLSGHIRKLKLQHALKLISSGGSSFTEIAHECGFADQSHFLRWFKLATGLSPKAYRTKFPKC